MLQSDYSPVVISIKASKDRVSDPELLSALADTRTVFETLRTQLASVVS